MEHTIVLYDIKVDKILEIVKYLRSIGVSDSDFEFSYNPVIYNYDNGTPELVNKRNVKFRFRHPEYLSYITLKYGK